MMVASQHVSGMEVAEVTSSKTWMTCAHQVIELNRGLYHKVTWVSWSASLAGYTPGSIPGRRTSFNLPHLIKRPKPKGRPGK